MSAGSPFDQSADAYRARGLWPRRVTPGMKAPKGCADWNADGPEHPPMAVDPSVAYGIGLVMGSPLPDGTRLAALDVDHDDYVAVARALLQNPPCGRVGSKGVAFFVRVADDTASAKFKVKDRPAEGLHWREQYPQAVVEVLARDFGGKLGEPRGRVPRHPADDPS